jgi:hypothetical protein
MFDASVVATPSTPAAASYFNGALNLSTILPRGAAGAPDDLGAFALGLDEGLYDVSVQARDGSLFAWYVRAALEVDEGSSASLGSLVTPYPAVLEGTIFDPQGKGLGGATVRAWLPFASSTKGLPATAVQIGETRTDDQGGYVLPLPPSLSR